MNIDIISQVCIYNDYPLFRHNLTRYRDKFNKIILYPSRHHGVIDMEAFLRRVFPETWVTGHTIEWTTPNIDWRQAETEPCLELSNSEWILFLEQDFFVDNWDKLWMEMEILMPKSDVIGWWNETAFSYVHPCFLLIRREMLEKTNKDFRAHPEIIGCDHFAMLTHDVQKLGGRITKLQDIGWKNWENAFHGGGFTYPYQNFDGEKTLFGVASPEVFMAYNYNARNAPIEQAPEWVDLSLKVEGILKTKFPIFDLINNRWNKFYV